MTPSGESVARVRSIVCCGPVSRRSWRNSRANSLARMIAWHRRTRGELAKRIILEDIVPDCGWPALAWLKPAVRDEELRIARSLYRNDEEGRVE